MLPVISTVSTPIPIQQPLVATPLPNTNTLRVPHNNVPPPISNVQINNNSQGGGGTFAAPEEQIAPPVAAPDVDVDVPVAQSRASASLGFGAPATFLAQIMGQNVPPEMQQALNGVLVEYEKQIARNFVRYRPSNATLPRPESGGLLGKILKQVKTQAPAVSAAASANTEVHVEHVPVENIEPVAAAPVHEFTPVESSVTSFAPAQPTVSIPTAIKAYAVYAQQNPVGQQQAAEPSESV